MNPTELINPLCPLCDTREGVECSASIGRVFVRYCQCGFELSANGKQFMLAGWAWNALPRPKPKTTKRKGKEAKEAKEKKP